MDNLEEFKKFARANSDIQELVSSNSKTWQQVYEQWFILGEDSFSRNETNNSNNNRDNKKNESTTESNTSDLTNQILKYIKGLNASNIQSTMNTVQKAINMFSTFNNKPSNQSKIDPLFKNREW